MDSALGLLLRYDDQKAFDVVLHWHCSADPQQQTRHTAALPSVRAHPKSVDLDVVSQGRHLMRANYIFEHAHGRETSPKVGHGCYVRVKILQGASSVEEIVWFGSRHAGILVVTAASRVFGQANAGVE